MPPPSSLKLSSSGSPGSWLRSCRAPLRSTPVTIILGLTHAGADRVGILMLGHRRRCRHFRTCRVALVAVSILAILLAAAARAAERTPADGPGSLISAQPMPGAPDGATAYRILYTSTGLSGDSIPVSGVVIVPKGLPPGREAPVVAWAHPTTGIVSRCAPSLARVFFASVQGLRAMLAHGYIVTATDYPGLGTPEVHPYLVGVSEGLAVLDSVRAARQIAGNSASRTFAVWGHSQGGHAALFAGLLASGSRRSPTRGLERSFLKVDNLADVEPWRRLLKENTPARCPQTSLCSWLWGRRTASCGRR
jgi:Secretory lipase